MGTNGLKVITTYPVQTTLKLKMNFLKFSLVITCFKKTHEKNTIPGKLTHHLKKKKTLAYLEFLSDAF